MGWRDAYNSLLNSARITTSIGMLIAGAMVFNYVITIENIPKALAAHLEGLGIVAVRIPAARQLHPSGARLRAGRHDHSAGLRPGLLPSAFALGIDPVHFGVMVVVNVMIGLCSPPYGLLLFMMAKVTGVPLKDIVRELMPFHVVMILALVADHLRPVADAGRATHVWLSGLRREATM